MVLIVGLGKANGMNLNSGSRFILKERVAEASEQVGVTRSEAVVAGGMMVTTPAV